MLVRSSTLRADTLNPLLTIRVPGDTFSTLPIFFPDGTRLVLAGPGLAVIDRANGTVYELINREPGSGEFTADRRFCITLDATNGRLLTYELSPPPDAWTLREVATHWSGDGTANDVIGGTHAVATEGLRFEPGRYGQAFSFDGSSKGVSFGRRLNVDIAGDRSVAYAAWIKPRRTDVRLHIASRSGLLGWSWSLTNMGRLAFCLVHAQPDLSCENGGLLGQTSLQPHRWYHVTLVRSASAVTLFVDGHDDGYRPLAAEGARPNPSSSPSILRLGAGPDGSAPFQGLIDEVLLFTRALSAEDLAQVVRATSLDVR